MWCIISPVHLPLLVICYDTVRRFLWHSLCIYWVIIPACRIYCLDLYLSLSISCKTPAYKKHLLTCHHTLYAWWQQVHMLYKSITFSHWNMWRLLHRALALSKVIISQAVWSEEKHGCVCCGMTLVDVITGMFNVEPHNAQPCMSSVRPIEPCACIKLQNKTHLTGKWHH